MAAAVPGTSRVVYFGRLPQDITESEIATLGIPFGRMKSLVISRKKFTVFKRIISIVFDKFSNLFIY